MPRNLRESFAARFFDEDSMFARGSLAGRFFSDDSFSAGLRLAALTGPALGQSSRQAFGEKNLAASVAGDTTARSWLSTALPIDGIGDAKPGTLGPALLVVNPDTAGDGINVAPGNPVLTVGTPGAPVASTVSTLDVPGDQDYYQVTLQAGQSYQIGMYAKAGGPSGVPLSDPYIEIRTADGTTAGHLVVDADGGAPSPQNNVNSGLDVLLTFEPTVTGTYYINARGFGNAGGQHGDEVGDYELFVNDVTNDPSIYRPYYSPESPLYSIDWGTQVNKVNQTVRNPDGNEGPRNTGNPQGTVPATNPELIAGKNVITIYFAREGDTFVSEDPLNPGLPPVLVSVGTADWEKDVVWTALAEFAKVADIVYVEVDTREEADFIFTTYAGTPGPGVSLLGSMSPPDYYDEGLAQFNSGDYRWTETNLQQGGFSYVTLIHEFGHGHGLAHPHDNGGHSGIMREVEGVINTPAGPVPEPFGIYPNYTHGQHNLNQQVFTMMSYQDGWPLSPYGNAPTDAGYGYLGGLSPFDIAAIQDKYGVNEDTNPGNDTYTLKDVNAAGTFYAGIWDVGGTDKIVYSGARNANIDLRAASLQYEPGGGGWVSYAFGIYGGFTIANGVTIENATTGSGNDTLTGNSVNNILDGGAGNDVFFLFAGGDDKAIGGDGADAFIFGAQLTAADEVDGGSGKDQVGLQGNYYINLGPHNLDNVETLALLSSQDNRFGGGSGSPTALYSYIIGTHEANVAAGKVLTVNYNGLQPGENVSFNGSLETDGAFFLYAGKGDDGILGGAGDDAFLFGDGGMFTAADRVHGGGGLDQLGLRGNYNVVMSETSMTSIETLALISGENTRFGSAAPDFSYNITMHDSNVAFGQRLSVNAAGLRAGETLVFNGSAETDGFFRILSGKGNDTITGGAANDYIHGSGGADTITGGGGADTYFYRFVADSTGPNFDTIVGFDYRVDVIDLPGTVTGWSGQVSQGTLSSGTFDADLAAAVDGALGANSALLFTPDGGEYAGQTFLVVDADGDGSYQAGQDFVFEILSPEVPIGPTPAFFV
jgi:serralysin